MDVSQASQTYTVRKGLWIFLGNLLPTQVSSILVNDIAMIDPISQTEDLGVLDSSLLSCPTCSPPASPVDSHKHTPVHPRAFTSSHSTPGYCLDKFHSLLTNLPASTLDPQQYILQNDLSETEDTPLSSSRPSNDLTALSMKPAPWSLICKAWCLLAPADLSCARLLRSSPPALLSFVWLVACPSCQSDLSYNSLCTLFHPLASLYQ